MPQLSSELVKEPELDIIKDHFFTDEQQTYLKNLRKRLEYARDKRDEPHEEFDSMTFIQNWIQNERWANTYIMPRKNKTEITFQSGILRTKLFSFISAIISLNLAPDISAYDKDNILLTSLGNGMEDIIEKTEELEGDEEKELLRIYELLKQGTVFLEEIWDEREYMEKTFTSEFDGKFSFKGWTQKKEKSTGEAIKNLISSKDVYLGNITKYAIEEQPYIFTVETKTYDEVESLFCDWEMFEFVKRSKTPFTGGTGSEQDVFTPSWVLLNHPQGEVEIVKYQSVCDNEYQILINGIPMLPIGYPLPWGRRYNITQQNLEPIRKDFSYGKSFVSKNRLTVQLLDEMIRMALLKTYKSFMPPYVNTSEFIIPQSVLMPGKITMGIPAGALRPVSELEVQGVTTGEFNMIEQVKRYIDENTASQTFTGMKEQGTVTATQIIELQRQARVMLGVVILAISLMEKKLSKLRLLNILQNWFDPIDTVANKARGVIENRYRIVSRERTIQREGPGLRFVIPTEQEVTPEAVMAEEDRLKGEIGKPVRIIAINPEKLKQADYIWVITINPKEKRSSELNKLMFSQKIKEAIALGLPLDPNYVKDKFAEVWGDDPSKLFSPVQQAEQQMAMGQAGPLGTQPGIPETRNIAGVTMRKPQIGLEQTQQKMQNISQSNI